MTTIIARIFEESKGRYGSPKVYEALEKWRRFSKNTVAKIMRENNLKDRVNRVYVKNPDLFHFQFIYVIIVAQNEGGAAK